MNRILFEQSELDATGRVVLTGRRARHIAAVLNPAVGEVLRVGVLNGARGIGNVLSINAQQVELACTFEQTPPAAPAVDLLLALPRPKVMRRLWAMLASLGVGRIVLTNAEKVERHYFDTHWLNPETYRPLLIEGLEQSGDTRMPAVEIHRRLKPVVEDVLDVHFSGVRRLMGQPTTAGGAATGPRATTPIGDVDFREGQRVLLAIGPEGGWSDYEIDCFGRYGFECVSLGWRTLRTDVACVALIAAVQARFDSGFGMK